MTEWGYTLSSEEFGPAELVHQAVQAEDAGFDFLTISDHFHPWIREQGHSPFVWTTIGGVAARTERIPIGTGVTCPILRYHPAIVAQAAATASAALGGRFFLGVGTGEALNEHVTGERWPALEVRQEMLIEAIGLMRRLWSGDTVDAWGRYFTVENARLFTEPAAEIPVVMAAAGEATAELAAEHADGLWSTAPREQVVKAYRAAGGTGPVYGQITLCHAASVEQARATAHRVWPNAGVPGQLTQDLPTWSHFEQAASLVTEDAVAETVVCGPDAEPLLDRVRAYVDAGFDHIHFHQVGPDQAAFVRFWTAEIAPALPEI